MIKLSDIVSEFMDKRSNDPVLLKKISKELDQVTRYMKKKKYIPNAKFNVKGSGMEMRGWKDNVNNYLIKVIGKTDRKGNISYELWVQKGRKYIHDPRFLTLKNAKAIVKNLEKIDD